MTITKNEVKKILSEIKDGEKVLEYIEHLEEHIGHNCCCDNDEYYCDCDCEDDEDEDNEWEEIETSYENKLTVSDWEELLKDKEIFGKDAMIILKRMRHVAAPTNSKELADMFGMSALYYSVEMNKLAVRLAEKLGITSLKDVENWKIIFQGWRSTQLYNTQIYALRSELYEALGNVDLSEIPLRVSSVE